MTKTRPLGSIPNPHEPLPPPRPLSPVLEGRSVRRRDFLNGILVGTSVLATGGGLAGCGCDSPPNGADKGDNHAICHAVRDGKTWDLPAPTGDTYDVVIVGGGISGLTTAWRLQKLGITNILVLEKEDPVGGFAKKDGPAEAPFGQAAAYTVFPYNDNLIELYTELGIVTGLDADDLPIVDDKYLIGLPTNNSYIGGKWYAEPWDAGIDDLPYDEEMRSDLKKFRDDMVNWYNFTGTDDKFGFDTPSDASTEDAEVRAIDEVSFADYIADKGWSSKIADFYRPYCRSAFGSDPEDLSAWAAINFFGSEFMPALTQPGGNAYLASAIAAKVGASKILTNRFVLRMTNTADGVEISYLEDDVPKTIRAKVVVYAGPRYLAKYVLPDLVASGRDEAKDFHYTPYLVANVHVTKTPEGMGYDNWIQDVDTMFTDIIVADWAGLDAPEKAPLDRPNTLSCYCPLVGEGRRVELLTTTYEDYEKRVLDDLEKVIPGVCSTVTGVDLYRWGHAMLQPRTGFVFGASRVGSQAPEGRVLFANHDVDGLPAFENAVGAAFRAADEALAILMAPA